MKFSELDKEVEKNSEMMKYYEIKKKTKSNF